jgi:hypothetical protein
METKNQCGYTITELCKQAIIQNEVGGDLSLAYKFSDPDGVRSGKSGYSFGVSQFDIENNWDGILCLKDCGFRPKDMDRLFEQRGDISDLDKKLKKNALVVDLYDKDHLYRSIQHVSIYCGTEMSDETFVHLVDYHNQFYITPNGKMHRFLKSLDHRPTPVDIFEFKKTLRWYEVNPADVVRRFETIRDLFE